MRALVGWFAVLVAVVLGYSIGVQGSADSEPQVGFLTALRIALSSLGGICAILGVLRRREALFVPALLSFALLRGAISGYGPTTDGAGWASPTVGVRTFEVVGASRSGPRCEIDVRNPGTSDPIFLLRAPPESCPRAQGQRVQVVVADMRLETGGWLGGYAARPERWQVSAIFSAADMADPYWGAVAQVRAYAYRASRGDPERAFVVASTLGVRSALSPPLRTSLRRAGLGHLIAVSGLHVFAAAWSVQWLAARVSILLCGRLGPGLVAGWIAVAGYVGLTGGSAPAVRAAVMFGLVGFGRLLGRPTHGLTSLTVAAALMVLWRPSWALEPSFQLSIAAMAALVRSPPGTGIVVQSWRVTWAVMPVALWHFGDANGYAVVSNLVAVPVFSLWVVPWCFLGALPTLFGGPWWLDGAAMGAGVILDVAAWVSHWPRFPLHVFVAIAGVSLIVRWIPAIRRLGPVDRALPPALAALGLLVVVALGNLEPTLAPTGPAYAIARGRSMMRIGLVKTGRGVSACLDQPVVSAATFLSLLPILGIDDIGGPPEREGVSAPHVAAFWAEISREGQHVGPLEPDCELPAMEVAADAVAACRAQWGDGPVVAVVGGGRACMRRGRWLGVSRR